MNCIDKYFSLPKKQKEKLETFAQEIIKWNKYINLISRQDIENICLHHILHSLSIAKFFDLNQKKVADIGTGGGFPGIPLAIIFPQAKFTLVDSIEKKTKVLQEIIKTLDLTNVHIIRNRSENLSGKYDYIVARAVSNLKKFIKNTRHLLAPNSAIIYLKGGDIEQEIKPFKEKIKIFPLKDIFQEDFFEKKYILYLNI